MFHGTVESWIIMYVDITEIEIKISNLKHDYLVYKVHIIYCYPIMVCLEYSWMIITLTDGSYCIYIAI